MKKPKLILVAAGIFLVLASVSAFFTIFSPKANNKTSKWKAMSGISTSDGLPFNSLVLYSEDTVAWFEKTVETAYPTLTVLCHKSETSASIHTGAPLMNEYSLESMHTVQISLDDVVLRQEWRGGDDKGHGDTTLFLPLSFIPRLTGADYVTLEFVAAIGQSKKVEFDVRGLKDLLVECQELATEKNVRN